MGGRGEVVILDPHEVAWAEEIGRIRQEKAASRPYLAAYGGLRTGPAAYELHYAGAAAELGAAIARGITWVPSTEPDSDEGDIAPRTQVRATKYADGNLILHPRVYDARCRGGMRGDRDDHAFILVTGTRPVLTVRGWVWGRQGKHPIFWRELQPGRPAFCVPQSLLHRWPGKRTAESFASLPDAE